MRVRDVLWQQLDTSLASGACASVQISVRRCEIPVIANENNPAWISWVLSSGPSLELSEPITAFCTRAAPGINIITIVGKEPNLWALCTSHTVGNNEKAGGGFAASRLSNSFCNSLAQLNLCKVQPFLVL